LNKYQCENPECKKTFQHAAKKTVETLSDGTAGGYVTETLEKTVCPHCGSLNFTETPEEPKQTGPQLSDIIDIKDCQPNDAKQFLDQKYVVYAIYQKNTILVKYKSKEPTPAQSTPILTESPGEENPQ
jgi:hypothetical protein